MMTSMQRVGAAADAQRAESIALLQGLVRVAREGEAAIQQRVAQAFEGMGCQVDSLRYRPQQLRIDYEMLDPASRDPDEHLCVVGQWRGDGTGRDLLFFAHPDGEPIAGLDQWRHDPFEGKIEDGRLYGWSVADDLMGVAIMTAALDAVLAAGLAPTGNVVLASTPSKRRAQGIVAVLDQGYPADGVIYLHPAESGVGLDEIKALASGILHFRITVEGQLPDTTEPGHTAFAHRAVTPIDKAQVIIAALHRLDKERGAQVQHPALQAAIGRSTNILISHIQAGDPNRLSRVSPQCVVGGTVSFPPGETVAEVREQVNTAVRRAAEDDPRLRECPPQVEWVWGVGSAAVPMDHPLYQTVAQAIQTVTGIEPHINPLHTGSDIRNPILHSGLPCVGFGSLAGDLSQNECHDEWVDVEDYLRAVKVAATVIVEWCGARERR
jgi:acetylornithine deacetylase